VTLLIAVIILDLVSEVTECTHIGGDVIRLVLNSGPTPSQTTRQPRLDFVFNGFARVSHFPHEVTQLVKELINLSVLMPNLFPFDHIKVATERLTKASLDQVKEDAPLAVRGILVEGNPLSLGRMAVDVWMDSLIPALGRSFEEGNHETDLVHVPSQGTTVVVELGFHVVDESSQVLGVALERFDIKLVWPFLTSTSF
jgi:hypothetical protein